MFLQIHTLTAYPASLLNRDDAGLAKRIPFGNAVRLRVSSQCLKRHWREDLALRLPELPDGQRTRSFFTRTVLPRAVEAGVPQPLAESLIEPLAKAVIDGGVKEGGDLNQPVLFGLREADYFVQLLREASQAGDPKKALEERLKSREEKDNLKAMSKSAAGLTAALFGRMVTSDLLARVDAPVHVAHAFSVHAASTEMDYFTVVDDLNREDETGAAHANQTELGAGLYYGYVAVDVPLLVSNLTGCEAKDWQGQDGSTARRVLEALIDSILRQSPGAKKGSTAPYAWADALYLEVGRSQPRALSNAFLDALRPEGKSDLRNAALSRLAAYVKQLDEMYGGPNDGETRQLSTTLEQPAHLPPRQPVPQAVTAALDAIFGSKA
ncbi:type I-E CRISPR-associated protein Cas7/Cse4/CasC [Silanimonas lenta]|uniref:type I-E CRISPR-associated protein Cas7/Cse4/CasC n=1 Tax=Silanimonas lenta TaxID=265429 RepID=UPI000421A953|nr:type I-E CRISPR-associated protein Cas7/Cse4/CasC [Silanimonas lenta]